MVTWQNRIWALCIPVLMMTACGQGALQQPDLIAGRFQVGPDATGPTTKLNVINYYAQTGTGLPAIPDDLATVDASSTGACTIFLGFSEFLNGNLIQLPQKATNGQVTEFLPAPNVSQIIEVYTCDSTGKNCTLYKGTVALAYRPDGGYVPKPDTPVSNFPPPAIAVTLSGAALAAGTVVAVHVIADKLSDTNNIFMAQATNSNGDKISTPDGKSPVAGTVWFQTK
jgi:hypothetical protein